MYIRESEETGQAELREGFGKSVLGPDLECYWSLSISWFSPEQIITGNHCRFLEQREISEGSGEEGKGLQS